MDDTLKSQQVLFHFQPAAIPAQAVAGYHAMAGNNNWDHITGVGSADYPRSVGVFYGPGDFAICFGSAERNFGDLPLSNITGDNMEVI